MSKLEQILTIEPHSELRFKGPFTVPVTSYMKLTNPTDKSVFFKIKTTVPKKYCVRPNSGLLQPKSAIEISISLQPFYYDPAERNKHKFMVQTAVAPEGSFNIEAVWKDITPDQLMDSKLKCIFELPSDVAGSPPETDSYLNDEKAKRISDNKHTTLNKTQVSPDADIQKIITSEMKQLKDEETRLRQENLHLQEEILRLRHGTSGGEGTLQSTKHHSYAPVASWSIPMWAVAIIITVFGIIIGKFML